jgi:hypothetical protein
MGFRRLLAILFVVAMTFAPIGQIGMAEAQTASTHHGAMASLGHCDQQPRPDQRHKVADKGCCAAMCIAVVAPDRTPDFVRYHPSRERPASESNRRGFLGEIATPPPRLA